MDERSEIRSARILGFALTLLVSVVLATCSGEPADPLAPTPLPPRSPSAPQPETITAVPSNSRMKLIVDRDCRAAEQVDATVPLYHIDGWYAVYGLCNLIYPLTASGGRQLTAGEWVHARGQVAVTCVDEGTRYDFRFDGLVPDGVYTIWHDLWDHGFGALASHPGDLKNAFTVTTSGTANFSVTGTAGPMTTSGLVPACTLPFPSALGRPWSVFWVVYHTDGRNWGAELPPETTAIQLVFPAK